jgi:hypothetical protein
VCQPGVIGDVGELGEDEQQEPLSFVLNLFVHCRSGVSGATT